MLRLKRSFLGATVLWSTTGCAAAVAAASSFMGLGDLPGGSVNSGASGVSADGMVDAADYTV